MDSDGSTAKAEFHRGREVFSKKNEQNLRVKRAHRNRLIESPTCETVRVGLGRGGQDE